MKRSPLRQLYYVHGLQLENIVVLCNTNSQICSIAAVDGNQWYRIVVAIATEMTKMLQTMKEQV